METEGRRTDGRQGGEDVSNVVRLPVDWLGPREELVPFGPAADRDDEPADSALSAEAFWGEQAASLHEPIQAPMPVAARVVGTSQRAAAPRRMRPRRSFSFPVGPVSRGGILAAACGFACFVLVALVVAVSVGTGPARVIANRSTGVAAPHGEESFWRGVQRQEGQAIELASLAGRESRQIRRARVRPRHQTRARTASGPHATEVSYHAPTSSNQSASGGSYVPSQSSASVATTAPTTRGSSSSTSAGPIGPGAPFGPGQMGPAAG